VFIYICVYTPLKTRTPKYLLFGPVPFALAPVLGLTAIENKITLLSLFAFLIMYTGKMLHLMTRVTCFGPLYEPAGFKIVSLIRSRFIIAVQTFAWAVLLLVLSVLPVYFNLLGSFYFIGASVLGVWLVSLCVRNLLDIKNPIWPKKLFLASMKYFSILAVVIVIDKFIKNLN